MKRLSGRFRSSLIIGLQGIRARKLRTLLSMVSLFLGVLAVVVVQAGAAIGERALLADLELTQGRDGTRTMYINPQPGTDTAVLDSLKDSTEGLALLSSTAIIGEPGVRPVNEGGMPFDSIDPMAGAGPQPGPGGMVCYPGGMCVPSGEAPPQPTSPSGQAVELRLTAMTGDIRTFRPFRPRSGHWLDFASAPAMAPRLVLNEEAAKGFGLYKVPAEMRVNGATQNMTPQFVGVVDDGDSQANAYVRLDELSSWLPPGSLSNPERGDGIQVYLGPDTVVEKILTSKLKALNVEPFVETVQSRKQMAGEIELMRLIFLSMAGLVLLIGVAGILNVGLATVGERVEEFALRRAVGTSRALLAGIVLCETLLTGLLTAAAAIGVGFGALKVVSAIAGGSEPFFRDLQFPWEAGVAGIIAGLVAGILGGFVPAIRAARIPIATVMRA